MQHCLRLLLVLCLTATAAPALAQSTASGPAERLTGFGRALAVHDSLVYVGEPDNIHRPGRVYAYHRAEDGSWTEHARLEAADGAVGDGFGSTLTLDDSTLLVGAQPSGAAYVFTRDGDSWVQSTRLSPSDSVSGYGASVALAGDVAAVSASDRRGTGAVYVYRRAADGSWTKTATLVGSDVQPGDRFGATVALTDGHLLAAAPSKESGSVYAFRFDAPTEEWVEVGQLTSSQLRSSARLGSALHLHGTRALAGAPRYGDGMGTVFAFRYDAEADTWRSEGQLLPFDGTPQHFFGASIAQTDAGVWVGAPGATDRTGALYHFSRDADTGHWAGSTRLTHPDAEAGALLGTTIAASEGVVATGLLGADYGAGTAAIFTREADRWTAAAIVASPPAEALSTITGEEVRCTDGTARQFDCQRVDLLSFLPISAIGGSRGVQVNDIWGWTDPETGTEYALVGRMDGTSFVDVSAPSNPVYIGELPLHQGASPNIWRDIKVYQNHAFIVADNAGEHGMQVFDLTQLRDVAPEAMPVTFDETTHYDQIHSAHNVVINTDTGFAYVVGSSGGGQTCGGGLHMVNIQNPAQPSFAGCFADPSTGRTGTGYTHDAQCVTYNGPDTEHQGKEICFGANETAISIADVTNKENPVALSTGSYPNHAYVHQGWLTEDQHYFYLNDELDEINDLVDSTRTLVWDVSDLDDPQLVREFYLSTPATDHNLYVKGTTMYQSNYVSGLRIVDVSNPTQPKEVGHFDTVPFGDNSPGFGGSWSNYPFFQSGTIVVTSMQEGLFILRKSDPEL